MEANGTSFVNIMVDAKHIIYKHVLRLSFLTENCFKILKNSAKIAKQRHATSLHISTQVTLRSPPRFTSLSLLHVQTPFQLTKSAF